MNNNKTTIIIPNRSLENDKKLFLMTDLGSWLLAIGCRFLVRFALLIEKSSIRKGNLTKNQ